MYPNVCPMMQPPCCCMIPYMPMMHYPLVMTEYEFEEKKKKKHKRDGMEIDEYTERGMEKKCPPAKPIEVPVPSPKPAQPVIVEAEQNLTNIVNIIEVEAPDIINTLIALGLTLEAARQLIKTIVKITQKHKN